MSHWKTRLRLLEIVEVLADKTTRDAAIAPETEKALGHLFAHDQGPPHHQGRPAERPNLGEEVEWAADVKAYCILARERAREHQGDERAKDALRAARALVEEARRIVDRPHKKTSTSDPLTDVVAAHDLKELYEDHEHTDRTGAADALQAYFEDIEERAALVVHEIKKQAKLTATQREWRDSLRKLANKPDRYRQNEAAEKLVLLQKALNKLRA